MSFFLFYNIEELKRKENNMGLRIQFIFLILILATVFYLFGGWKLLFYLSNKIVEKVKKIKNEMENDKK